MKNRLPLLALALGLSAPLAHAQMLQPGLWELTTSNMQVDGKPLPDMQFMLGQLKNLLWCQARTHSVTTDGNALLGEHAFHHGALIRRQVFQLAEHELHVR